MWHQKLTSPSLSFSTPAITRLPAFQLARQGPTRSLPGSFLPATDPFESSSPAIIRLSRVITQPWATFKTPPPVIDAPTDAIEWPQDVITSHPYATPSNQLSSTAFLFGRRGFPDYSHLRIGASAAGRTGARSDQTAPFRESRSSAHATTAESASESGTHTDGNVADGIATRSPTTTASKPRPRNSPQTRSASTRSLAR